MPSKNRENNGLGIWGQGVVLSFDFITVKSKNYFSETSPQGAYEVIRRFLIKNGFEHRKDSDYVNINIDKVEAVDLLIDFSEQNKWFPLCINKMNISPNVMSLDISQELQILADEEWKQQKDNERKGVFQKM